MAERRHRIYCTVHEGYFYREPKRGRVPSVCGGKNEMCNANPEQSEMIRQKAGPPPSLEEEAPVKAAQRKAPATTGGNPSLDKGKAAKDLLEAQGWDATGKAWVQPWEGKQEGQDYWASVTGARGEEMIHLVWRNGELMDQVYNLWNLDVPSKNGRPNAHLPFDPEEIPDAELARYLVGVKVRWWNKLAGKEESAICGRDSITIEHLWTGTGDEYPGARIVKFIDASGGGYRAFRLEQLVKVG